MARSAAQRRQAAVMLGCSVMLLIAAAHADGWAQPVIGLSGLFIAVCGAVMIWRWMRS